MDHDKLWEALREMGIPDHLTCLLRNLYVGKEVTVRTLYGTTDWFKMENGVPQGCLLSSYLFNLYAGRMRNAGLDEIQAKSRYIYWISIVNLGYLPKKVVPLEHQMYIKAVYCHPAYLTYMQSTP